MATINSVVLVGNLTRTPSSVTRLPGCRCAPCVLPSTRAARTGDRPVGREAELLRHHRVGPAGRELRAVPRKGRRVGVQGRLEWREWEAQDGSKRQAVEVVADAVQFLDSRGDGEGGGSGGSYLPPADTAGGTTADFPSSPTDDDIPF